MVPAGPCIFATKKGWAFLLLVLIPECERKKGSELAVSGVLRQIEDHLPRL